MKDAPVVFDRVACAKPTVVDVNVGWPAARNRPTMANTALGMVAGNDAKLKVAPMPLNPKDCAKPMVAALVANTKDAPNLPKDEASVAPTAAANAAKRRGAPKVHNAGAFAQPMVVSAIAMSMAALERIVEAAFAKCIEKDACVVK